MKNIKYLFGFILLVIATGCSDFLEESPRSVLSEGDLITPENVDGFATAAYASLGNDHYDMPFSLWPYGNVRSDDAYKGGSGPNDIQVFHFFEISENIRTDFGELDKFWFNSYIAISRINRAIRNLNKMTDADFPLKETRIAEMKFLRGHFYFMLKIMFKHVPYITEDVPVEDYGKISNRELTNDELWESIAIDFETAIESLPVSQQDIGRASRTAAYAYLAKVRLYQAYEQDNNNQVTSINQAKLQKVIEATNNVLGLGFLETDFASNFLPGSFENGPESIFAIQYTDSDNTLHGRLNFSDVLSTPQGLGCCDFHKPSQNLVNAYKTDTNGLPLFNTYNNTNVDYNNLNAVKVDPRLYHTVAIPNLPYKYDNDYIYEEGWVRSPNPYGYYASLKENVSPGCGSCFVNIDPFYGNSKNRIQIRYADVLLMRAEALIELGQFNDALPLINQIRNRASQSTNLIGYANNLNISPYVDGVNCTWTQDFARQALRWERRLEFAMEGSRFFDLVRWGIAAETLNKYYLEEKDEVEYYSGANFNSGVEEYCPIPQAQINFSQDVYKQNTGYN